MKLATYDDGSRDGQLVVVSRDLSRALYATHVATRLQQALDDWNFLAPQLQELARALEQGKAREAFTFEVQRCMAPLPRAPQWAEVQACRSDGASAADPLADRDGTAAAAALGDVVYLPGDIGTGPVAAGGGDEMSGLWRCAAGLAVITGDIAQGAAPAQALDGVRLLMLTNAWHPSLPPARGGRASPRRLMGAGVRSAVACGPVVVTPEEVGAAWSGGRLCLPMQIELAGRSVPVVTADAQMALHFGQLIAGLSRGREVRAGSVVSAGVFASIDAAGPALAAGERVRVEVMDRAGATVFGAIEQTVADGSAPTASSDAARRVEDGQSRRAMAAPLPPPDSH